MSEKALLKFKCEGQRRHLVCIYVKVKDETKVV